MSREGEGGGGGAREGTPKREKKRNTRRASAESCLHTGVGGAIRFQPAPVLRWKEREVWNGERESTEKEPSIDDWPIGRSRRLTRASRVRPRRLIGKEKRLYDRRLRSTDARTRATRIWSARRGVAIFFRPLASGIFRPPRHIDVARDCLPY